MERLLMYKIYTKDLCGYCTMAKQIFKNKELEYEEIHVDGNAQALAHLRLNNLRTVPQIYDPNGNHIGGYMELREHLK